MVGFVSGWISFSPPGCLHLDDGAGLDEQAGDLDGFAQGAAAVVAEVDDQHVDAALTLEAVEDFLAVAGRALEVILAARGAVEVAIERGDVEHADAAVGTLDPIGGLMIWPLTSGRGELDGAGG